MSQGHQGFKIDTEYNRVRLSKGTNMEPSRYAADYIPVNYTPQGGRTLGDGESVQTVRSVWTGEKWELHFVCRGRIDVGESPGERTADVDRGISNTAASRSVMRR